MCADVIIHQRMDYRPLSQGTQRQFLGVLKQLRLVTNLFTITCAVNSERERETERERGQPCQADTSPLRWTSAIRWFGVNFVQ